MPIDEPKLKTVGTPEGDNEYPPDVPLHPVTGGLEIPSGNAPDAYKTDKAADPERDKPTGIEKFIDEVARGEFM